MPPSLRHSFRRPLLGLIAAAGLVLSTAAVSGEEPVSGPQRDDAAPKLPAVLLKGDKTEKIDDALAAHKDKPVLVVIISELTRPTFGLVKQIDKYSQLRQPEGLQTVIIHAGSEREERVRLARLLKDRYGIAGTVLISEGAAGGPAAWAIHEEAALTVLLLGKDHRVQHNLARRAPELQDFAEVRKAIDALLGPSPVTFP